MPDASRTVTHPVVREKVQEMLDKEDKDFSGVLSTAKTALTLYSDPLVANNISVSDFTIDDLVNYQSDHKYADIAAQRSQKAAYWVSGVRKNMRTVQGSLCRD
jgi:type IV secretory pathway TraG/TraD family ATPase VirD4